MAERDQQHDGPSGGRPGASRRMIAGIVIVVLLVIFGFLNRDPVEVRSIVTTRDSRLIYVILGSALLGAVAGYMFRRGREQR
jgi:uncharacterized integral membrane protein